MSHSPIGAEPYLLSYEAIVDVRFRVHGTKPDGEFSSEDEAGRADVPLLEVEVEDPGRKQRFGRQQIEMTPISLTPISPDFFDTDFFPNSVEICRGWCVLGTS